MPDIRDDVFLGAKTTDRTRDEAWRDVEQMMKRLNVENFDLFQLHSVGTIPELDKATASGGALETLIEMREQGLTRWLGITGHGPQVPSTILESLNRFDFDTVMFPLAAAICLNPDYRRDAEALLNACQQRNVGVQTIKMLARGGWGDGPQELSCWYDPHRDQPQIDQALWWVLSQPIHTAPTCGEISLLPKVLNAAERFVPLTPDEQAAAIAAQRPPQPLPALAIPEV